MPGATKHFDRVRKLFPDWAEEILRLAMRSEEFRSTCEDYGMAIEALEILETKNRPNDAEKISEYRVLVTELEKELEHELLASRGGADRR